MKSICLRKDELLPLLQGNSQVITRKVRLREFGLSTTPGYDYTFRRRSCWNDVTFETLTNHKRVCPFPKGSQLQVLEEFQVEHDFEAVDFAPSRDCGPLFTKYCYDPSYDKHWKCHLQYTATPNCETPAQELYSRITGGVEYVFPSDSKEPGDWKYFDGEFWKDLGADSNLGSGWEFMPWAAYTTFPASQMHRDWSRLTVKVADLTVEQVDTKWYWLLTLEPV